MHLEQFCPKLVITVPIRREVPNYAHISSKIAVSQMLMLEKKALDRYEFIFVLWTCEN